MYLNNKSRILTAGLALICLIIAQIACASPLSKGADSGEQPTSQEAVADAQVQDQSKSSEQGDASDQGEADGPVDEQSESPVEPEFGSDTLPCPPKGATLILGFDHALTVNYEETSITHFLHQGYLTLMVTDGNGTIKSQGSPSLTYTMEGVMSEECSLNSEGTMIPSAHGSCQNGVVSLFIDENWMALSGEMECIDTDGDIYIVPFNAPAMGLQQHSGQDGAGEIFYLVEGSEGYSTMRPFVEGEGYHTWTLYAEDIPLVPLVP